MLAICTVPYHMMADERAMSMNEKFRHISELIRQVQQRSVLPVKLLDVAKMMGDSLPHKSSSDSIHFDKPKGTERLNGVFRRHINVLGSDLENGQFTFGTSRGLHSSRLGQWLTAWEGESILEEFRGVAEAGSCVRHPWRGTRWSLPHHRARWCHR